MNSETRHMHHAWQNFLRSHWSPWLTHGSVILMTAAYFGLLLSVPFWLAFIPGALLAHRIGVMLHEYIHGIPFQRYRDCLAVLSFFDGLMMMFGLMELFRGTHLSHHRWLNSDGDSGFKQANEARSGNRLVAALADLEMTQHLKFYIEALKGKHSFVRGHRIALAAALSLIWIVFWIQLGRPDIVWKLIAIAAFTTAVPVSLRGAIEHHSRPGDAGFANEYRVFIPLFNLNRHVHHHEEPRCPWYLLQFRTPRPLGEWNYFTHWFRVYIRKDFVLMRPPSDSTRISAERTKC
ncbi:MAG: fatty acid desaturase [Verrucomicrobia bacterium]|nr:fatty acid desaturase [Verrucomicrobiota bacterium]